MLAVITLSQCTSDGVRQEIFVDITGNVQN